jgi:carboxyl-terminal processing protease
MHPVLRPLARRSAWGLGLVAALGGSFTLGSLAGAAGPASAHVSPRSSLLDEAADEIARDGLHPVSREALDAAAIRAMLAAADDEWGSWGGTQSGSSYAGVGLLLHRSAAVLRVSQVASFGPADRAGVEVGDVVQLIDGRSTAGLTILDAAAALRGQAGTPVVLRLSRHGRTLTLTLTRGVLPAQGVSATMLTAHVGRVVVPSFTKGSGRRVRDGVRSLLARHATGLVLDLRGDPGGLLTEAVETASVFLDGGEVVSYARRDEQPQQLDAEGAGDIRTPLVVLVDGSTASAAEVVAGALQDRGRAVVVGTRTFGKGTVQEPHRLPDGSSLALTVARYALPSGRSVEGVGIEPDIQVDGGDAALVRAVEVLSGLLADTGGGRG